MAGELYKLLFSDVLCLKIDNFSDIYMCLSVQYVHNEWKFLRLPFLAHKKMKSPAVISRFFIAFYLMKGFISLEHFFHASQCQSEVSAEQLKQRVIMKPHKERFFFLLCRVEIKIHWIQIRFHQQPSFPYSSCLHQTRSPFRLILWKHGRILAFSHEVQSQFVVCDTLL